MLGRRRRERSESLPFALDRPSTWRASSSRRRRSTTSCSSRSRSGSRRSSRSCRRSGTARGDDAWLRLTRFFGTLLLINFAIGVATGLVQEFQFGMNWSVYSDVRRRRVRRAAGDRGPGRVLRSRRRSSGCGSSAGTSCRRACTSRRSGSRRSARGCRRTSSSSRTRGCSTRSATRCVDGKAQLTNVVGAAAQQVRAERARLHTMLAGLTTARGHARRRVLAPRARPQRRAVPARPRSSR